MKLYLTLVCICLLANAKAQNANEYWKRWNTNYPVKNATELLKAENLYAKYVEERPDIAKYYVRKDAIRFKAIYMGKIKPSDAETRNSIKKVLLLTDSDPTIIDKLCQNAVLMKVGDRQIWMLIQTQVLAGLKEEVKKGDQIILYCAFLNEHNLSNKLYNNFVISEFIKE